MYVCTRKITEGFIITISPIALNYLFPLAASAVAAQIMLVRGVTTEWHKILPGSNFCYFCGFLYDL